MQLTALRLKNFKNYNSLNLSFKSKIICFTGDNGVGKTNLLDAIHYLSMTRSYFHRIDKYAVKDGEKEFTIDAQLKNNGETRTVTVKYNKGGGKTIYMNDSPVTRLSDHIGRWPCSFIAPDDKQLLYDSSRARVRFMDMTLSQMDNRYLKELQRYNKIVRQRNKMLKNMAAVGRWDDVMIQSIDKQFYVPTRYIYERRREFAERLSKRFTELYERISGKKEEMKCIYISQLHDCSMEELLNQNREKDKNLERTSSGLHKDDIKVKMNGKSAKIYGSQGQLKSFVIALKLAQFFILRESCGVVPFVLLDDLFEKVDAKRLKAIVELVNEISEGQVFITDTDASRVHRLLDNVNASCEFYEIKENQIQELQV